VSRARAARAAAVAGLLGLSGCGWFSSSSSPPVETCPNAVVLRSLANTAVFGPGTERTPQNVAFYGLLSEVDRKCDISGGVMHLSLDVIIIGQRGPAGRANSVDFSYFVAVTAPDQSIISKQPFGVRIGFDPNQIRAGVTDHIEEDVNLSGHKATDLNVLIGFQQTPEVVDFYRHYRGR
jgi:hypothetical protein